MLAVFFAALFTVLRGLPFIISQWSFNRYKNGLIGFLKEEGWDKKDLEDKVKEKFILGKLSTGQYTEINRVITLLKEESFTLHFFFSFLKFKIYGEKHFEFIGIKKLI